jgi:penicillin amidase
VLADDQGNIGYDPHALVPLRPWAGSMDPVANVPLLPWLPLPGLGFAEWGGSVSCAGTGANAPARSCFTADTDLPQAASGDATHPVTKGYLATANSDPAGYGATNNPIGNPINPGKYLSFDWDDPTAVRYSRIAGLLNKKTTTGSNKVSMQDMQDIQSDHVMLVTKLFTQFLPPKAAVTGSNGAAYGAAFDMFTQWATDGYDCPTALSGISPSSAPDGNATHLRDSAACLLFHIYLEKLLTTVFNDDFAFVQAVAHQSVGADAGREIRAMLYMLNLEATSVGGGGTPVPPGTEYCSNITTAGAVTPVDCFTQEATALVTAFLTIQAEIGAPPTNWLWGKYHTLTFQSPAAPLVAGGFQAGPFARPGGALTVDVGNPDSNQSTPLGQAYSHGSNVRFIGEILPPANANTLMQLPGIQHDQPFGVFSNTADLITPYVQNQYFNYLMSTQVNSNAVSTQGFAAP